ncbi:GMP synthase-Glutamine amidotransferase [Gemmobacter aquatilis]|uniref:GMP synthase-Glutamine amidotransferase n=1 Tax=Gemmobacter aquatilis TaxID=933059 RepID=A0A1H8GFS8_9RHOB|nr:type 1 glutamine amidotransferase [Gemmobacter aquatilis]SEN42168.1 GMP synthase-Glutamine amidotransferase [Gemmobacter aquatilis]
MRVAIVENTAITHHGQVGVALHEAGARIGLYRPFADGRLPELAGYDALVVFGGEQTACDDAAYPYLPVLAQRMRAFSAADRAVLGICLGSQILARGFGGRNILGATPEFGWCEVALTAAAADDPVLGALPPAFAVFQWHSDTFTLPDGAVHLGRSGAVAHQAFRLGRATWGTQFHFEANRRVVADWTREFPDLTEAMQPGWAAAHPGLAERLGVEADRIGLEIARGFVAQI